MLSLLGRAILSVPFSRVSLVSPTVGRWVDSTKVRDDCKRLAEKSAAEKILHQDCNKAQSCNKDVTFTADVSACESKS